MRLVRIGLLAAMPLAAHVGSPDVFFEGQAGPYRLLVTIRPPQVVPGVAEIEIRSASPEAREIHIVPLRMTGLAATLAPVPDLARPSKEDPQYFTGSLWLMTTGSWKVRVDVDGAAGKGTLFVPVAALATRVMGMQKAIAALLLPLCVLLAVGLVGIAGAAAREAQLDTGKQPDDGLRRRSRIAMAVVGAIVAGTLWFGYGWWGEAAADYSRLVYKPLRLAPALEDGARLAVALTDPGWLNRSTADLLPDHGHLMHLYVIRMPEMDRVWHLHPERRDHATFIQQLPDIPAGRYALYGDIVHASGLAETATGEVQLPDVAGQPLAGDDAGGAVPPIASADPRRTFSQLPGGYRLTRVTVADPYGSPAPRFLRFRLEDPAGRPASDVELYMGMLGHAAVVAADGSVFAHIHPSGSVAMPALELAGGADPHAGHATPAAAPAGLPAEVAFPFRFPKDGKYRIFVQMKHGGEIVTGVFDLDTLLNRDRQGAADTGSNFD